jgi:hypothetical protein
MELFSYIRSSICGLLVYGKATEFYKLIFVYCYFAEADYDV